jgi:REP element-mobilizing transposase RayT
VLSTLKRRGILGSKEGRKIATEWRRLQNQLRIAFIKLSFVPDHVHVAFRAHPAVSPVNIAVALMNSAQEVVQQEMISNWIGAFVANQRVSWQLRRFRQSSNSQIHRELAT